MDIRVVINSFILIFIFHIIILNINNSYNIGTKKEHYENKEKKNKKEKKDSILFLTKDVDENDDFKQRMMKYIHVDEPVKENEFEKKNLHTVEASNTQLDNNNRPNFESNVADISKFFKINYDNLDENELKSTSIETLNNISKENITIDPQSKEPCNVKSYGRESTVLPDSWSYKNELPMNGGNMNGIHGFDNLESQFAVYNPNKLNLQSANDKNFNEIPHNDLRKPIVYEN